MQMSLRVETMRSLKRGPRAYNAIMLPYRDSRLIKIGLIVFFVLVLIYAYFEARGILFGPTITISPRVLETTSAYVKIQGTAERIAKLSLNGKSIAVTESGAFDEPYVLVSGYNRIALSATDKYGKRTERVIEVVYSPTNSGAAAAAPPVPPPPADASSTPAL